MKACPDHDAGVIPLCGVEVCAVDGCGWFRPRPGAPKRSLRRRARARRKPETHEARQSREAQRRKAETAKIVSFLRRHPWSTRRRIAVRLKIPERRVAERLAELKALAIDGRGGRPKRWALADAVEPMVPA